MRKIDFANRIGKWLVFSINIFSFIKPRADLIPFSNRTISFNTKEAKIDIESLPEQICMKD